MRVAAVLAFVALAGRTSEGWPADAASCASVVPNPASVACDKGAFALRSDSAIVVPAGDAEARRAGEYLSGLLQRTRGTSLAVVEGPPRDGAINFARADGKAESYRIAVRPKRVTISGADASGLLYGAITLWELVPAAERGEPPAIPALAIDDAPRFAWRGLMLDSARHMQSPEFIERFLDWMALHKLNVLHWHLTDDQGWRLEIKKYPRLAEVASQRVPAGPAAQADIDRATGKPRTYGGYYTQDTVRGLVAYAAGRGITIVPEIELPGHGAAVFATYPQFAASADPPKSVPADWGVYDDVYGVDDATFGFFEDVLAEVMALFPSRFIHVGGDEVQPTQWAASPAAQAKMKELGIAEPKELQHYFTQRVGKYLQAHGRRLVGWDEILAPGMDASAVVMSWRGVDGGVEAAKRGNDVVMAPWPTLYFDFGQRRGVDEPPGRTNSQTLEAVYRFEPAAAALDAAQQAHVLGLEAAIWTEHIRTEARVAHMAFPRAAAVAESGWSQPARREWRDFLRRMPAQLARYETVGLAAADSAFAVDAKRDYDLGAGRARVALSTQAAFGEIRYTTDGSEPGASSPRYAQPLALKLPTTLRAAAYAAARRISRPRLWSLDRASAQHRSSRELQLCSDAIGLSLEDDAPLAGARAIFDLDLMNPCWIFKDADLDTADAIEAAVGQVPFNFRIGKDVEKIRFPEPATEVGELNVHRDSCDGERIASLPLGDPAHEGDVSLLRRVALSGQGGRHDLCLRFAQPRLDPLFVLDWIRLVPKEPPP